jgi:hypothetical protein
MESTMIKSLTFKLGLFVLVWYELVVEFHLNPDTAFFVMLALVAGFAFARGVAAQIVTLVRPFTFGLLLQALLWIGLLWWMAPGVFTAIPFVLDLLIVLGLALIGARCRHLYEDYRQKHGFPKFSEHSGLVLLVVFGTLGACIAALQFWGSLWPLLGYALLPALPFSFGWRMGPLAAAERPDAKLGDAEAFRDAGLSEER